MSTSNPAIRSPHPMIAGEFQMIRIERLVESKTNPRTKFDDAYIDELSSSIKAHGIAQPIVVRYHNSESKTPSYYEIIAGTCRYRAAKKLGHHEVPALVRAMSDQQVLEIQLVENIQRNNLSPLEEAHGIERLIKSAHLKAADVAKKLGKSEEHVRARLKLLELAAPVRQALDAGKIKTEHALVIARAPAKDQSEGLRRALDGLNVQSIRHWAKERGDKEKICARVRQEIAQAKATGHRVVSILPWGGTAPKGVLSGSDYVFAGKKKCQHLAIGFYVRNDAEDYDGRKVKVCTSTTCAVHKEIIEQTHGRPAPRKKSVAEKLTKLREHARKIAHERALNSLSTKFKRLTDHDYRFIAKAFVDELWHDHEKAICKRHGWDVKDRGNPIKGHINKLSGAALQAFLLELALSGKCVLDYRGLIDDAASVDTVLKRHRVDKLEKFQQAAMRELSKPKPKRKK